MHFILVAITLKFSRFPNPSLTSSSDREIDTEICLFSSSACCDCCCCYCCCCVLLPDLATILPSRVLIRPNPTKLTFVSLGLKKIKLKHWKYEILLWWDFTLSGKIRSTLFCVSNPSKRKMNRAIIPDAAEHTTSCRFPGYVGGFLLQVRRIPLLEFRNTREKSQQKHKSRSSSVSMNRA